MGFGFLVWKCSSCSGYKQRSHRVVPCLVCILRLLLCVGVARRLAGSLSLSLSLSLCAWANRQHAEFLGSGLTPVRRPSTTPPQDAVLYMAIDGCDQARWPLCFLPKAAPLYEWACLSGQVSMSPEYLAVSRVSSHCPPYSSFRLRFDSWRPRVLRGRRRRYVQRELHEYEPSQTPGT